MTPMLKLMRKLPRADMSTVVRAVLMLIEDESINGKTTDLTLEKII